MGGGLQDSRVDLFSCMVLLHAAALLLRLVTIVGACRVSHVYPMYAVAQHTLLCDPT